MQILQRIHHAGKRAVINTLELMIIVVVVAAIVGAATGILNSKINGMSSKMDTAITAVTSSLPAAPTT